MNNYRQLRKKLLKCIETLSQSASLFCVNPEADFTRNGKLSFETVLKFIITMEGGALKDELYKYFEFAKNIPTASALVQRRDKIKVDAFKTLFYNFNDATHTDKTLKGYRLLAVDGSEIPIDNTIHDEETTIIRCNQFTNSSYSAFHLNASYDILECTFDDALIQGQAKMDENDAYCQLVDRYKGKKAIFIADRGYESYNCFEHVTKSGNKYITRVKDIGSKTSITRSLVTDDEVGDEFDIDVFRMLILKNTKMVQACPHLYKFMPKNMRFDFMSDEDPFYEFNCRIVRFKLSDGSYECIITNLDREEFSAADIKKLYHMRWDIETSFRTVKYALDLNAFHSKKRNLIKQEIYARLLLHNFCQRIVQKVKITRNNTKHKYQPNFTRAFHIIREALKKKGGKNPPVDDLIAKEILPVRQDRSYERNVKTKRVVHFNYRYD